MRFCSECNSLLYSRGDVERRLLLFACRHCKTEEPGDVRQVVYKNDMQRRTKEQSGIVQDIMSDITLPHSEMTCPSCSHSDAVYFQDQSKRKHTRMILFYVCTKCNFVFGDPDLSGGIPGGSAVKELQGIEEDE